MHRTGPVIPNDDIGPPIDPGDLVLAMNAGSSSLKSATYGPSGADGEGDGLIQRAVVEEIGHRRSRLWVRDASGSVLVDRPVHAEDHQAACRLLFEVVGDRNSVVAVGHRIVHGGLDHRRPEAITQAVLDDLDAFVEIDPLHLPAALDVIRSARSTFPAARHVACFDTTFHRSMPAVATRFPLPEDLLARGIQRYGFHGLVAESITDQLPEAERMIIAHLGSGVSVTAVLNGRSVDTTMGMTPSGGVMMGTRPGDLDPGVILHLLEGGGLTTDGLRDLVSNRSGLLGVSGSTSNMRELLIASHRDDRAALAVEMFCYQASKAIGAMAAVLDGIDVLVFSGGIGERSPQIRSRIAARLGFCGVVLDEDRNDRNRPTISPVDGRVVVHVVEADEERVVAGHAREVLDREQHEDGETARS